MFGVLRVKNHDFTPKNHIFSNFREGGFFYRFVMVVRKNLLEYIVALVVAKNKVRLKKCLKKFQI
jgi:hypothetical protein